MGNSGGGEIHQAPARPGEDGPYNPMAFRWQAGAAPTGKPPALGQLCVCRQTTRPAGLGGPRMTRLRPWAQALSLCVVLGMAGYQFTKTAPMATGGTGDREQLSRLQGVQHSQAAFLARQDIPVPAPVAYRPNPANPGSVAPMRADRTGVTVLEKATVLQANARGQYFAAGRVNGVPVDFVLDSGAEFVTIGTQMAVMAGIRQCVPVPMDQHAPHGTGCKAFVHVLEFGGYQVRNVEVMISDAIRERPLLGANVLSLFNIKQHGSRLFFSLAT